MSRELEKNLNVCRKCSHHFRLSAPERLAITLDEDSFQELDADLDTVDPLSFPEYKDKLACAQETTGLQDAILTGTGAILGWPVLVGVFEPHFIMGSMGSVVGEKITRLAERAIEKKLPLLLFSASGGARMQEGVFSLMQMAKTSAAISQAERGRDSVYLGVDRPHYRRGHRQLRHPGRYHHRRTWRPDRLCRAAGDGADPEGEAPPDFQTAEFCLKHGLIDLVAPRQELKATLARILSLHCRPASLEVRG